MNSLKRQLFFFLFLLGLTQPVKSDSADAGAPGAFLNFGVGGRPIGMGKAFTGVADDVDALYWNPGGLGTFRSSQVTVQQTQLVGEASFQYLGLAQPVYTYGCIGAGVVNLSAGNVDRTDSNFIKIGNFDNRETGYFLGYGHRFGDHWGLGGSMKMAENIIDSRKARGTGADIGAIFMANENLRMGAMVRNVLQPKYQFDTDTETFSRLGRLGASYKFLNGRLMAAADFEKSMGGQTLSDKWYLGLEGKVFENITLRTGINTDNITAGAGVGWKSFILDYAAEYQELGLFHRMSLKVFFGGFEVDVSASPSVFSPSGIKRITNISILCRNRSRLVKWLITIRNNKGIIIKSFQGYDSPPESVEWDGTDSHRQTVDPGIYYYALLATDNKNRSERSPVRQIKIISPSPIELEAK